MSQPDLFGFTTDRPSLVIIDSGVLLLFVTGLADPASIKEFPRTRQYSKGDHDLLLRFLEQFREVVTTPNVLTETTNLAKQANEPLRSSILKVIRRWIPRMSEEYVLSEQLCRQDEFMRLGLTDLAITELVAEHQPEILVLTADVGLYEHALNRGTKAVNFTHIVARKWDR